MSSAPRHRLATQRWESAQNPVCSERGPGSGGVRRFYERAWLTWLRYDSIRMMKCLGLVGGMSWESTAFYYRELNRRVRNLCGGLHSAPCRLASVDFADIERLQAIGDWEAAGRYLGEVACDLERANAEAIVLCTNTMHCVADAIQEAVSIPLIHIVDVTAKAVLAAHMTTVGLLATQYTMEKPFYRERLASHGVEVVIPSDEDRAEVHRIIYEELCRGKMLAESRERYLRVVRDMTDRGAEAVVFGCTEIGLLLNDDHLRWPVFDSAQLHIDAAVEWALSGDGQGADEG